MITNGTKKEQRALLLTSSSLPSCASSCGDGDGDASYGDDGDAYGASCDGGASCDACDASSLHSR